LNYAVLSIPAVDGTSMPLVVHCTACCLESPRPLSLLPVASRREHMLLSRPLVSARRAGHSKSCRPSPQSLEPSTPTPYPSTPTPRKLTPHPSPLTHEPGLRAFAASGQKGFRTSSRCICRNSAASIRRTSRCSCAPRTLRV
jgi:hypothetical protein